MKVDYCSDLHLEFGEVTLPGGDVLVLAGDICEARSLSKNFRETKSIDRVSGLYRYQDFFEFECSKYKQVFYIMGNHEHYHGRYDKTYSELTKMLPENVALLENQSVEYDGVLFVGATLWTDFNRADPITLYTVQQGINDFRVIQNHYQDSGLYYKLTTKFILEEHRRSVKFIKDTVKGTLLPVVVITHHSPSFQSVADCFRGETTMNGGYASDLSELILDHSQIKYWLHGHMHNVSNYEIGTTTILANPRGYFNHEASADEFTVRSFEL